ncbi:MAG: hypothetical protein J5802_10190 [Butyrivibrio sp.]|nr:hypothetical protein [Butyrivibrio sp.]
MEDNKKKNKKTIKICVLIGLVLLVTIFKANNMYCKREISSWMHDFYDRENFAFKEKPDSIEFCPIRGIWLLSDLAQYKEATDTVVDPSEHDKYIAYFKNADNILQWDNITEWLTNDSSTPYTIEVRMNKGFSVRNILISIFVGVVFSLIIQADQLKIWRML